MVFCQHIFQFAKLVDNVFHEQAYFGESVEETMDRATAANYEALDVVDQIEMYLCNPEWTVILWARQRRRAWGRSRLPPPTRFQRPPFLGRTQPRQFCLSVPDKSRAKSGLAL
jgi:hypothetical protein